MKRNEWVKSTRCSESGCIEVSWRTGKLCGSSACVEVAIELAWNDGPVHVRDSKNPDGPVLTFTAEEWIAFIDGAKAGEFDL